MFLPKKIPTIEINRKIAKNMMNFLISLPPIFRFIFPYHTHFLRKNQVYIQEYL